MAVHPKLTIAGIAIAGLGLIGAGAGATFTAQVSAHNSISSGGVGLSLNDETGSDLRLGLDGTNLGSHFAPISKDLRLKNTGTLDMASTFLSVTATGCQGGAGAPLVQHLAVKLTDETAGKVVYDGTLCALVRSVDDQAINTQSQQGFTIPRGHAGVGGQLPHLLKAGEVIDYRLVIQPDDAVEGLPTAAQKTSTLVSLVFTGFDY